MARTSPEEETILQADPSPAVLVLAPQAGSKHRGLRCGGCQVSLQHPCPRQSRACDSAFGDTITRLTSLFFWFIPAAELEERAISIGTKRLREEGHSQSYSISKSRVIFVNQNL